MAYNLIQRPISTAKYALKCPYGMTPEWITIHNTASDASAAAEISYMQSNNLQVSYHVAVDDKEVIEAIPFNRNAWHAGDGTGNGNMKSIGIEICYSKSGGTRFIEAEKNAAAYTAKLLKERGWGLDRVKKHQDWSGKYCPHRTLDMGWNRFLNMIQAELDKLNGTATNPATTATKNSASNGSTATKNDVLYRVRKSWKDEKSQIGAYKDLANARKALKAGYSIFDSSGKKIYSHVRGAVWDVRADAPLKAGQTVTTGGLYINEIEGNVLRIDSLGGWVPAAHVTKEGGKDGDRVYKGDHVTLDPVKVTKITGNNLCMLAHGYEVKTDMLWIKM